MRQADALYQLQEVDLLLLRGRKRLREIADTLANDDALRSAQAQVDAAQNKLSPLRARSRDLELEIQGNEEKARQSEQRLYSGTVNNPREMEELQQEIEALKRRNSDLETELLETMMAVEEAEAGLRDAEANMETIVASRGDEHRDLLDEKKTLEAQLTEMQSQRSGIATEIDTDHMQLYESMRSRKHNQPIALMEGNTCGICGVAQTISIEQAVRQGSSLVHCSNCDRILVYRP